MHIIPSGGGLAMTGKGKKSRNKWKVERDGSWE